MSPIALRIFNFPPLFTHVDIGTVLLVITRDMMDPPAARERAPLSNVCNNVSVHSQQPPPPVADCLQMNSALRKAETSLCDDKFFLYHIKPDKMSENDPFTRISDEMLLHIFKWLPKKTLLRCAEVCRRFNRVSKDDALWVRIDLSGRTLRCDSLVTILNHRLNIVRMAQTEILCPTQTPVFPFGKAKLQYLDLSMCTIDKGVLRALLQSCYALRKLSLENIPLDDAICMEIAKNQHMESLNLTMCTGLSAEGLSAIAAYLTQLQNFNVAWTSISSEAILRLVTLISPTLMRINLAGCRNTLIDESLATLVRRCPNLVELDVSDCAQLTSKAIDYLCKLPKLEYLSLSRCYNINTTSYLNLVHLESLLFLDIFGLMSDATLVAVQNALGSIGINKFYHSSIARPTIGSRRTSIWGLRTRE
ncbi:S-phase kinase-associated protein 2 [Anopheles cruzii]|uniref:S-phase kinase-associated protein 2 n=1 Tax=Anopheles cruzii TaxID=68878 RepID=UPI0022EC339C|nr:S-phase kinase-associated protein 2 [Anopheles cruzii]